MGKAKHSRCFKEPPAVSSAAKKGSKMMAELLDLATLRLVILKDTVLVR